MREFDTTVFAAAPGGGNPCLVVLEADRMSDEEKQARTKKYGMEAVFVEQGSQPDRALRLRYFTPDHELSSCGHATVAAVAMILREGLLEGTAAEISSGGAAVFETIGGPLTISWDGSGEEVLVRMAQGVPELGPELTDEAQMMKEVIASLGITESELGEKLPIQAASVSRPKLLVPMASREALDALSPDLERLWNTCDALGVTGFYPFAEEDGVFYARQYPNRTGYPEDPATGVAAAALCGYLALHGAARSEEGRNCITIRQGFAMGRPSEIVADTIVRDGKIVETGVSGRAKAET